MKKFDGNRKFIGMFVLVAVATVASAFGILTDDLVELLKWIAGFFFAGNSAEHVARAVLVGKGFGVKLNELAEEAKNGK